MLNATWESDNLVFSEFGQEEALLAKSIFDKNNSKQSEDPTFTQWPESEYEQLILRSNSHKKPTDIEAFYLRKISKKSGHVVGYVQLEINAPNQGSLWIPMLTIDPAHQRGGIGAEVVASVISTAQNYTDIVDVGLNVYVENIDAFRFWYLQGFTQIRKFEREVEFDKKYNCLVLYRDLQS